MTKKIKYPIHKMGKFCGYEEYEDGSIKISSSHYRKIDDVMIEKHAINELLQSTTQQCQKILNAVIKAEQKFWDDVVEDYGLDLIKYVYVYQRDTKTILRKEKPKEELKK